MIVRAILAATSAVMLVLISGFVIATSERRGDPVSYAVGAG